MFNATWSTGLRKGPASLSFLSVRTVEVQNRHWAMLSVGGPV